MHHNGLDYDFVGWSKIAKVREDMRLDWRLAGYYYSYPKNMVSNLIFSISSSFFI